MNTATIKITAVERKEGVSQKTQKPWTKFIVHAEDGGKYDTFDAATGSRANAAIGSMATATFETGDYGNDLKGLVVIPGGPDASSPFGSPMPPAPPLTTSYVPPAPESPAAPFGEEDPKWALIGLRKTRCALWAAYIASPLAATVPSTDREQVGRALVIAAEADIFNRVQAEDEFAGLPF